MSAKHQKGMWIPAAIAVFTCAGAFVTGYAARVFGDGPVTNAAVETFSMEPFAKTTEPQPTAPPAAATEDEIRQRTAAILQMENRVERWRELTQLLAQVAPDNWRPLLDDLIPEMERRGWGNFLEYRAVLNRIGAVMGEIALNESLAVRDGRTNSRAQQILEGWAAVQPRLALEWMNRPPPKDAQMLWDGLLFGIGSVDPELAFATLRTRFGGPGGTMMIRYILEGAIQLGGLRRAEELYTWAVLQEFPPVFLETALYNLATKHQEATAPGQSPKRMLEWFTPHFFVADPKLLAGGNTPRTVIRSAAAAAPLITLEWLDAGANQLDAGTMKRSYTTWAEAWQSVKLEEFLAWVDANPEHPQHTVIAAQAIKSLLIRDNPARARSLLESVTDANTKANLAATIEAAEAKAATNKPR